MMIDLLFVAMMATATSQNFNAATGGSETVEDPCRMIREDRIWEFASAYGECQHLFKFEGTETVNGNVWHRMVNFSNKKWDWHFLESVEAEPPKKIADALLREEKGKIYILLPGNETTLSGTEVLLYDFNVSEGKSFHAWHPAIYDDWLTDTTMGETTVIKRSEIHIDGVKCGKFRADFKPSGYDYVCKDIFSFVEGVGNTGTGYPFVQPFLSYVGSSVEEPWFNRLLDTEGNVIYRETDRHLLFPAIPFAESYKPLLRSDLTWVYLQESKEGSKWIYGRFGKEAGEIKDFEIIGESEVNLTVSADKCEIETYENPISVGRIWESPAKREVYILDEEGKSSLLYSFAKSGSDNLECRVNGSHMTGEGPKITEKWMLYDGYEVCRIYDSEIDGESVQIIEGIGNTGHGGMAGIITKEGLDGSPEMAALYNTTLECVYDDNGRVIWQAEPRIPQGVESTMISEGLDIRVSDGVVTAASADGVSEIELTLFDTSGRRIASVDGAGRVSLPIYVLEHGIYVARAHCASGETASLRMTAR